MDVISLAIVLDLNITLISDFFYLIAAEQIHGFEVLGGREKNCGSKRSFGAQPP